MLLIASDKAFNIAFGMAVGGGFALWLILFPGSVIRFYTWFHRGRVELPSPGVIRWIGFGWLLLVSYVMFLG
jgi:hypothetical protein